MSEIYTDRNVHYITGIITTKYNHALGNIPSFGNSTGRKSLVGQTRFMLPSLRKFLVAI